MKLMFRKTIGLTAALAMLAGPAMAQQGPQQGPPHDQNYGGPEEQYAQHPPPPPHPEPQHDAYGPPHGGWHEGDHYNGERETVDWHQHHLHQPPPGYEWVQSDNQFVLIAVTTGIIASIIASSAAQ
jgi:Ni/Co efflux regulator RcnB